MTDFEKVDIENGQQIAADILADEAEGLLQGYSQQEQWVFQELLTLAAVTGLRMGPRAAAHRPGLSRQAGACGHQATASLGRELAELELSFDEQGE